MSAYTLTYDANGNLITGDGKFRTYDGFNHLVQIRNGNNATATILENYTWHPLEDRILAKSVYETNGSWKENVYYFSKEFVRVKNATGKFDYKYIYQNGQLVAQQNPDGSKLFFHNDHLGSVGLVTNESGAKVEETMYAPFGEIISGGTQSRYDYTGKEFDSVTGDYDFNARMYSPNRITLNTPDNGIKNIYKPQNLNRYSYVSNNPYRYTDPTGKYEEDVHRDLTRALAVAAGYPEDDADTIADADQSVDTNSDTKPGIKLKQTNYWHFQSSSEAESRLNIAMGTGDLNAFGMALHTSQDSYSHAGLNPLEHLLQDIIKHPDKTYNYPEKADIMARNTFNLLAQNYGLSKEEATARWYDSNLYSRVSDFNRATTSEQKANALNGGSSATFSSQGRIIAQGTATRPTPGGFQWVTVIVRSAPIRSGPTRLS